MKDHKDAYSNINTQIISINYAQIRNTETFDSDRADSLVWVSVLKIIKTNFLSLLSSTEWEQVPRQQSTQHWLDAPYTWRENTAEQWGY